MALVDVLHHGDLKLPRQADDCGGVSALGRYGAIISSGCEKIEIRAKTGDDMHAL